MGEWEKARVGESEKGDYKDHRTNEFDGDFERGA
jgi:hypothetical protein